MAALLLAGCSTSTRKAPVEERSTSTKPAAASAAEPAALARKYHSPPGSKLLPADVVAASVTSAWVSAASGTAACFSLDTACRLQVIGEGKHACLIQIALTATG